jgi:hypothetical protein
MPSSLRNQRLRWLIPSFIFLLAILPSVLLVQAWANSSKAAPPQKKFERARLSKQASIHVTGQTWPEINLSAGHEIVAAYQGDEQLQQALMQNQAQALALTSADFDEDGVPDLVSGYASRSTGILALYRGNVDANYPNSPEAQQRRSSGVFTDAPFLSPARVFAVSNVPDFLGAGDFDADGHWDVVCGMRGDGASTERLG